jgi:hypothetical protein
MIPTSTKRGISFPSEYFNAAASASMLPEDVAAHPLKTSANATNNANTIFFSHFMQRMYIYIP